MYVGHVAVTLHMRHNQNFADRDYASQALIAVGAVWEMYGIKCMGMNVKGK
jgi:hypothetical protein